MRKESAGKSGKMPKKKDSGSARRRNNKYEKRAAARIALTCIIGQPGWTGVRKIYDPAQKIPAVVNNFSDGLQNTVDDNW